MPLISAASSGLAVIVDAAIVAVVSLIQSLANLSAACAGGGLDPEIVAAKVSRMWYSACSITSSGVACLLALAMRLLSVAMRRD